MAIFPKIQSPCPYQDRLASVMDGDTCRMCKRQVFDLSAMSDGERVAFMQGCAGEVCVSYKLPLGLAAAMAAAALAAPMAAAAQETGSAAILEEFIVVAGGVKDVANVRYIEVPADNALPELPVVVEEVALPQPAIVAVAQAAPAKPGAGT